MPLDRQLALDLINDDFPAARLQAVSLGLELRRPDPNGMDLFLPYRAPDGVEFLLRLRCDGYDDLAPSFQFVSPLNPELTGPDFWPRMEGLGYARGDRGEIVFCTPGVREYHQHPSHRAESHVKSIWKLPRVVAVAWQYLMRSGRYIGRGGV